MKYFDFIVFFFFLSLSLVIASERKKLASKTFSNWVVDVTSLIMHFFIVPALQVIIVGKLMMWALPSMKGSVNGTLFSSLGIYLALDYLWYWNHRIYHANTPLWLLHRTHHAPETMDLFVTARNLLVTHFLMVYFWGIGAIIFLLNDPTWFIGFAMFGMVLNFWGHTSFSLPCSHPVNKILSTIIVTPREHLWHHSKKNPRCNYGTVISLWDRLHGTFYCESNHPEAYGDSSYKKTITNQLLLPWIND